MITFKKDDPTYGKAVSEGKKNFMIRQGQYVHVIFDVHETTIVSGGTEDVEQTEEQALAAEKIEMLSPGTPSYGDLVSAIVRYRYSEDDVEAIQLNGKTDETASLEAWRKHAKDVAADILGILGTLDGAKASKMREIEAYDKSEAVNSFIYAGETIAWTSADDRTPNKSIRMGLRQNIADKMTKGEENITIWLNGKPISLPCAVAEEMMCNLEDYAYECFNVTEQHKARVSELTDIEAVLAYDYTVGYPDKLSF